MKAKMILAILLVLGVLGLRGAEPKEDGIALTVYRESEELLQWRRNYGGGQQYDPTTGQYIQPVPGWGVVKVRRKIPLKEGLNIVRFQDVASSIDATTVLVASLTDPDSVFVQEQNYE